MVVQSLLSSLRSTVSDPVSDPVSENERHARFCSSRASDTEMPWTKTLTWNLFTSWHFRVHPAAARLLNTTY